MSVLSLLVCLFVLSACGESSPPSHPLTTGDTTSTNDGSPTATGNPKAQILPITVDDTATNLSTYPGGSMDLKISTSPYAQCSFVVTYGQTMPSKAAGIIPQPADASGVVTWHWRVDTGAHTGTWPLTISAILPSGFRTTLQVNVTVTLAPISVVNSQTNLSARVNGTMNLTIATAPGVMCKVQLNFGKPGRLLGGHADTNGIASWNWLVGKEAVSGTWPITITAILADGEASSIQVNLTVLPG